MKTGGAHASSVESIPLIAAVAEPFVFLAGRPAAERAADAWRFRFAGFLLFFEVALWNNNRIVGNWIHDRYYHPHPI